MVMGLPISRLQRAEHYYMQHAVVLPGDHTLDDAMKPEYWAHVATRMKQHDTVRIIPEDGSYFAEALVLQTGPKFVKMKLIRHESLEENGEPVAETVDFFVKYNGPHDKHVVIRRSDNEKLVTGLSKADANRWMNDHIAGQNR